MNIQRIRRLPRQDEAHPCDYCDEPVEKGYRFSGVTGPRSGSFMTVCDSCLSKCRKSRIGFHSDGQQSANDDN